ncbi:hypothetical protein BSL78_01128 [Apostichopus japonicus]|uniref:Uncharacterized protein n=1 Tax=Stichopus japonicus TaxID=307972 RepID=A0A2G8LNR9_STIJA|nr:hypothetical protein BSL78_01128 [Apostichopus japonicus]
MRFVDVISLGTVTYSHSAGLNHNTNVLNLLNNVLKQHTNVPNHDSAGRNHNTNVLNLLNNVLKQHTNFPNHDSAGRNHNTNIPNHDNAGPNHNTNVPNHDNAGPNHNTNIPNHDNAGPNHNTNVPSQHTNIPNHDNAGPNHNTNVLNQHTYIHNHDSAGRNPTTNVPNHNTNDPNHHTNITNHISVGLLHDTLSLPPEDILLDIQNPGEVKFELPEVDFETFELYFDLKLEGCSILILSDQKSQSPASYEIGFGCEDGGNYLKVNSEDNPRDTDDTASFLDDAWHHVHIIYKYGFAVVFVDDGDDPILFAYFQSSLIIKHFGITGTGASWWLFPAEGFGK